MIASEVAPWAKTGGLADVTAALPAALARFGHDVTTILPKYRRTTLANATILRRPASLGVRTYDVAFHVATVAPRQRVVMVDVPELFDREGYYTTGGVDFQDNAQRFGLLVAAALEFAESDEGSRPFDVIHAHDWQAGLASAFVRTMPERFPKLSRAGLVFTIHNLAYQGIFAKDVVPVLGLPWTVFTLDRGEFWGQFGFLKTGLAYSDVLTTVSPTYASETMTPEFGCGLDGVLRSLADRYVGILNGIDTEAWNPATDVHLPATFDSEDLSGKAACKRALLERFGMAVGDDALARPMIGLVSRLVPQKGIELIRQAADALLKLDATWIFVGSGEPRHEQFLRELAERFPRRVGTFIGFDESLAHLVEAGSDVFLMPSMFEPCGLNQMYSLRYGTVPIVRAVGGLDDTIQPYTARATGANGFKFAEATPEALVRTTRQALRLYQNKAAWMSLMRQGMTADHSWETSAREYVRVYRRARHSALARMAG